MWDLWPCSICYRAYFGTMKFRQRLLFCFVLFLILVPFIWLRFRLSEDKHPLAFSPKKDGRLFHDHSDFNTVVHHHVQRSSDNGRGPKPEISETGTNSNPAKETEEGDTEKDDDTPDYQFDDPWQLWKEMVTDRKLSSSSDPDAVNMILEALTFKPIVAVGVGYKGTQLKASMLLEGKQRVVFKPLR